ncbi:putative quinol monooxygenase [Membranihabitans maritimus]|uniref:putative quinol monooxygenase n=1 Tax=Membranihabitans maritimus TaxID=2904244 RepID=UPI001F265EC3|nr:antibiotic biosynthesis monooxygenase family protein [Membranihabitans maritimus]
MKNKYGLHGYLKAKKGSEEQLSNLLLKASELVSSAEGCHLYIISKADDPQTVWITEVWENKEFHDHSLEIPGVRELIGKAMELLDEMPKRGQELTVLGGLGLS